MPEVVWVWGRDASLCGPEGAVHGKNKTTWNGNALKQNRQNQRN